MARTYNQRVSLETTGEVLKTNDCKDSLLKSYTCSGSPTMRGRSKGAGTDGTETEQANVSGAEKAATTNKGEEKHLSVKTQDTRAEQLDTKWAHQEARNATRYTQSGGGSTHTRTQRHEKANLPDENAIDNVEPQSIQWIKGFVPESKTQGHRRNGQ